MTIGSSLPPVERRVLRQDILLGLRSGILNGEIPPGTRLLEIPLATELGVTERYVQKIRGGVIPHARHFQKLAELAGVKDDEKAG